METSTDPVIPELHKNLIAAVQKGLPAERFEEIRDLLDISDEQLLRIMDISESTLHRRRKKGQFTKAESEHLARVAQIFEHAIQVLGDAESARRWMTRSEVDFDWETPLAHLETEQGAREVDDLLGRIEHGVI